MQAYLKHRLVVCERRTAHRLKGICDRLHLLEGFYTVFLNLDEVIRIIREEDDPEEVLKARFGLSDIQVEAVLNIRLKALRKLHELEILQEREQKQKEKEELEALLAHPEKQWQLISKEIKELQKKFSLQTALGKRRTTFAEIPVVTPFIPPVEKEEVTVVCSLKGWIRVLKGHKNQEIKYKEGDSERFIIPCLSADRLLIMATNGRSYTIAVDKLPRGKAAASKEQGDPLAQFIDLGMTDEVVSLFVEPASEDTEFILLTTAGYGFRIKGSDLKASVRAGKQVMQLTEEAKVLVCLEVEEQTHLALIGENRKLLIFPLSEIPRLSRGKGVRFQKYKLGDRQGVGDVKTVDLQEGLSWMRGDKVIKLKDLKSWSGKRGAAGTLAPLNFPRTNRFEG